MGPTDFRQFARPDETGKAERLFRAAVSAYCALVRPTRRETAQLDDLALPLYSSVPPVARRFAAAALSECKSAPPLLIRRLVGEPVEISAPLLVRSPAVADVELIALIGRHGLPHARAIARRTDLNPVIGDLLDALRDPEIRRLRGGGDRPELHVVPQGPAGARNINGKEALEDARTKLRAMMRPSGLPHSHEAQGERGPDELFRQLRETAVTGHLPFFETALADALDADLETARGITRQSGYRDLCSALHGLGLSDEQAFLLVAALFPAAAGSAEAIRLFLYRYRLIGETADIAATPAEAPPRLAAEPIRRAS